MDRNGATRRRFLLGTGAVLGSVTGAGCVGGSSPGTSEPAGTTTASTETTTRTTTTTATTTSDGAGGDFPSRKWVPSPGSITEVSSFAVGQRSATTIGQYTDRMNEDATLTFYDPVQSWGRWFGLDLQRMENVVAFGPPETASLPVTSMNAVVENNYNQVELGRTIESEGATQQDETYRGYDLYRMSGFAVAVDDGVLVRCQQTGGISGTALAKRVIETSEGDFPNYFDSLSVFARGRRRLGETSVGRIVTRDPRQEGDPAAGIFPRVITEGFRWQFTGSGASAKLVALFSKPGDAKESLVEAFATSNDQLSAVDYTVSKDGEVVELDATVPYETLSADVPYPPAFAR